MRIADAKQGFEGVLARRDCDPVSPDARCVVEAMLSFYSSIRADDAAPLDEDGDMLLFQWGTYDWGHGPMFELDLTRQFADRDSEGDDALWQLRATLFFDRSSQTHRLASGSEWCSHPAGVDALRDYISASAAMTFAAGRPTTRFEITFESVG